MLKNDIHVQSTGRYIAHNFIVVIKIQDDDDDDEDAIGAEDVTDDKNIKNKGKRLNYLSTEGDLGR